MKTTRKNQSVFVPHSVLKRQNALYLAILSALGAYGGTFSSAAQAGECLSNAGDNPPNGNYLYTECAGDAGTKDSKPGGASPAVTITQSLDLSADSTIVSPGQNAPGFFGTPGVVTGFAVGGQGHDEAAGGDGGTVTITNDARITYNGSTSNTFNSLIQARSVGGAGDPDNGNNDSNGGHGGLGQSVTVTNNSTGVLSMNSTAVPSDAGLYGIYAAAIGGMGGDQNNPVLNYGDQIGGAGGNASTVTVVDSGTINLGSSAARLYTNAVGGAIYAGSIGGQGGDNNGDAGTGGTVLVQHHGDMASYWQTWDDAKVFGIKAESVGGDGTTSTDNSDNGGAGGGNSAAWTQQVTVDTYGSILVDVAANNGDAMVQGAGVIARAAGGKGGTGPSKDHSGGNGGTGGPVTVNMYSGSVTTRGDNILGVVAQSLGGQGGDGGDGTALAGTGGGGGFGGNGGNVQIVTEPGVSISTSGQYATGVLAQSLGGGGGTGSDFVAVLGGQGGNGGNGGNAGTVSMILQGSNISTGGDHA
ncbi:autotransporter outer membrane beta-barrel domain-containing protein, partial [Bordetella sp. 02P26C-1]|nr:autotransporter outer membrane beta-barrel domain-containing protein [Bordetella sp. 02P26C-1]